MRKKFKQAFTIIETIVAIGLFGVGVLAIIGYYALSSQATRNSRQVSTATFLAQGLIEQTITGAYDTITVGSGTKGPFTSDPNDPSSAFQKQINVSLIDQNLNSSATDVGLKKIDVLVYWQGTFNEKQVQASTIITRK